MSDKMRWRYGDTNPVVAAVVADTVIEIGDLLWLDKHHAKPAHMASAFGGDASDMRRAFTERFLGVAMERSRGPIRRQPGVAGDDGDTNPIRVATTGVFEFDCPSNTFELGDLVGPERIDAPIYLQDQRVVTVTDNEVAIARVARREASRMATVLIDIRSTVMTGGIKGTS